MKLPVFLLISAVVSCVHQAGTPSLNADATGCLSAIARRVTAVPLETNATCRIDMPEKVVCAGNRVFVLCNEMIYSFNRSGKFMGTISLDSDARIHDYTIHPQWKQVIVLDNFRRIHYYTFDGVKQKQDDLRAPTDGHALQHIAYYSHSLWFTFERLSSENVFENGLLRFGLADRSVEYISLPDVDLGRSSLHRHFASEFAVAENIPYIYSPCADRAHILRDTLYLLSRGQFDDRSRSEAPFRIYPVRIDDRYLIASYRENVAEESNFLFVFDRKSRTAFNMNGLHDDFFETGAVTDLQPLDPGGSEYYFYKTGKDTLKSFPERGEQDNPVLFLVNLS
ncbi:MAG: 6-bladed beta-propeller [Tannerella sp.]|nr:6-bladed beta-propeller [Tannerella sp.]